MDSKHHMPWMAESERSSTRFGNTALSLAQPEITRKEAQEDEDTLLEEMFRWIPNLPTERNLSKARLEKPVAIPRINRSSKLRPPLPFMRAYSPVLRLFDIKEIDFLAFVDNLAVAQQQPAPLQVLNLAGAAVGQVPYHWALGAGAGMQLVAGAGSAAVIYSRTRLFLERTNKDFFAPRGLKARLCKDPELASIIDYRENQPTLAPPGEGSDLLSLRERRMAVLAPYIAPLSFNVPPPIPQRGMLDRISAKQVKSTLAKKDKEQQKHRQEAIKKQNSLEKRKKGPGRMKSNARSLDDYSSDSSSNSDSSSYRETERRIRKINAKAEQELISKGPKRAAEIEKKRRKEVEKVTEKRDKRQRKKDTKIDKKTSKANKDSETQIAKDNKDVQKLEYIVIESL